MSKIVLVLLAFSLAGSLYWNSLRKSELQELRSELSEQRDLVAKAQADLAREKRKSAQEITAEKEKSQDLRSRLMAQMALAEAARQRLLDAKANLREGEQPEDVSESLKQEKAFIDELEAQLKSVRQSRANLGAQGKLTESERKWRKGQDDAELGALIQSQQSLVQETGEKIRGLSGRRDFAGREALKEAQVELQTRKKALQELKDRKASVDQAWATNGVMSSSQVQVELAKHKQAEEQIQQTLEQERARYQAMKKDFDARKQSRQSRADEVRRLEAEYQAQQARVIELQRLQLSSH